jgi:hypothetical protein
MIVTGRRSATGGEATAKPPAPAAFDSRTGFFIGVRFEEGYGKIGTGMGAAVAIDGTP